MPHRTCAVPDCGRTFEAVMHQKYCGPRCKKLAALAVKRAKNRRAMPTHCQCCGTPMPAHRRANATFCSEKCSDKTWQRKRYDKIRQASPTPTTIQCVRCGETVKFKPRRKYCPPCSDDALREAKYRGSVAYKHRLRNLTFETFDPLAIHERDQWTCSLCQGPIDQALRYPDPMSASIDHVIPLSRGGTHSPANVASSHLACNVRKGNRIAETVPAG